MHGTYVEYYVILIRCVEHWGSLPVTKVCADVLNMCVVIDHTFHHMFNAATHVGSSDVHTKGWTQHMAHAQHTWEKNNMYVCIRMSNIRGTLGKRMSHTGTMCIVWLPCMTHTCYSYVTHISRVSR
ncbi:Protein Ycf2, partial [Frankliniella fusca]